MLIKNKVFFVFCIDILENIVRLKNNRAIAVVIIGIFFSISVRAQIDSLKFARNSAREPADKIDLDLRLGDAYFLIDHFDSAQFYFERAVDFATEMNYPKQLSVGYYQLGRVAFNYSNGLDAITYLNKALAVEGGVDVALELEIHNIMGIVYMKFGESEKSIPYFDQAIALIPDATALTSKEYINLYNNKGLAYTELGLFDSARFNHLKCLKLRLDRNLTFEAGQSFNNLGTVFYVSNEFDSALFYYEKGLEYRLNSESPTPSSIAESQINIAKSLLALKAFNKAEKVLDSIDLTSLNYQNIDLRMRLAQQKMELYGQTNRYELAYKSAQKYYELRDSAFGMDQRAELIRLNLSAQYADKQRQDSLYNAEKLKRIEIEQAKEDEIHAREDRETTLILLGLTVALLLMFGIMGLIYRNFRSKKRASDQILLQKQEVEKQRDIAQSEKRIAEEQKSIAQRQKMELEHINQEITDSINYAKRIQNAILPSDHLIKHALKDQFVLYLPKAIVAGDFYWVREIKEKVFFAAADCTGHGVPGALVSIICSNALNRSVEEFGLTSPGEILDKTTDLLLDAFVQSTHDVKDGMDISLCCLDKSTNLITFAGANNPLYIIRQKDQLLSNDETLIQTQTHLLIEVRGNKQSVGWHDKRLPFKTLQPEIKEGDMVYSITDGFPDQFGGERGKKYKYKQLKYFLLEIAHLNLDQQKERLLDEFLRWKGDLEQVDDICIFGYRVT